MNANPEKRLQGGKDLNVPQKLPSGKRKTEPAIEKLNDDLQKKLERVGKQQRPPGFLDVNIDAKNFFKWLYDANPFYLISTCLILYAQTVIFNTGNLDLNTIVSAGIIAGYTLLLMTAAVLIIRLGKVWNDLRSITLIMTVLLFFLSVSLDRIVLDGLKVGLLWQGGGLLFALGISCTLYRELKIRLSRNFLIAFCAFLGLFFLYPSLPAYMVNKNVGSPVQAIQTIFLFPVISGILFLFLIPAARQGKAAVKENPTPWRWPLCPWIIFGIFWLAAAFRTYLLTISFYGGRGVGPYSKLETGFSMYMLIPLVLAACILLVEYGIANRKQWVQSAALAGPVLFFLMIIPVFHRPRPYYIFIEALLGKNGNPLVFSATAALLFYAYALVRRIKYTEISLAAVLVLMTIGESELGISRTFYIPEWVPVAVTVVSLLTVALLHRNALSNFLVMVGVVCILTLQFDHTFFTAYHGAVPVNLLLLGTMVIMNCYANEFTNFLRGLAAVALPVFCCITLCNYQNIPWYFSSSYVVYLMTLCAVQAGVFNDRKYLISAAANILILFIFGAHITLKILGKTQIKGLKPVFWGILIFIIAFIVSMFKGGVPQRIFEKCLLHHKVKN